MVQSLRVWAIQGTNYTLPTQGLRILAWLAYVLVSFDYHQEFVKSFLFQFFFLQIVGRVLFLIFSMANFTSWPPPKKKGREKNLELKKRCIYMY
jgi:hypothetical protein